MATQVSLTDGAVASAGALAIQTNGTTQAVSISTGQVATLAQNPILTSGTANGVAYLNGSKAVTSGSALTFNGSTLAVTGVVSATQSAADTSAIAVVASAATRTRVFGASGSTTAGMYGLLSNTGGSMLFGVENSGGGNVVTGSGAYSAYFGTNTNTPVSIAVNSTQVGVFDTSGNLGLGVTPSAWNSSRKVIQVNNASLIGVPSAASYANIAANVFVNSSGVNSFIGTDYASMYEQYQGKHTWYTSPSGTAGTTVSFTQAMTLDASGNLGVGTTSPTQKITANGSIRLTGNSSNFNETGAQMDSYDGLRLASYISTGSAIQFLTNASGGNTAERARIDSSGNLLVGVTSSSVNMITKSTAQGNGVLFVDNGTNVSFRAYSVSADGYNAAATAMNFGKNSSTSRSINAGGTINASGADYAEYMTKAGDFVVAKGDVVGINAEGKLTNVFADAVSFVVKSTDPSYVGGDVWGNEEALGLTFPEQPSAEATDEEKVQYETDKAAFETALETARQKVDRIAFAGQVPVNVMGATAGQYIIPVNDNGAIKGEAVSNPTFEQYQQAVGKVIAIESDGRAKIIVKVA